ncbi:hypothetical protein MSA03_26950 [Microbacterium saccharophilum]|uniref:hypothetical protein n=1 Tax=Microbacterium saccharophilum TaxID=1213358 RepID=UPI0011936979|nr:hypothetical protein [Microbacterium saccharophilum]GEP49187.1 hypothetical protein MSA03_26950 [Microbacterium saccharophilum]
MDSTSEWRIDDAAAYDAVRSAAVDAAVRFAREGDVASANRVLAAVAAVDGFDRAAIDELAENLDVWQLDSSHG